MMGQIVSVKNEKTAVVRVERVFRHPRLGKIIKRHHDFSCQVESGYKVAPGLRAIIKESAPYSRRKHWLLVKVYD